MARTAVVVDDHADFRAEASALLESAGYQVVGSCPDGRSALTAITALHPDLVLLDVQLPDIDGFTLITRLSPPGPSTSPAATFRGGPMVVLVSTREAADYGGRVARSGAAGFICKADLSVGSLDRLVGRT
jgi:CheY-like chemotaxis protein